MDEILPYSKDYLPLIGDDNKSIWVSLRDILFILRDSGKEASVFQTRDTQYTQYFKFEQILELTGHLNFMISDSKILVNVDHIKKIDSDKGIIYFDDDVDSAISITMSKRRTDTFKKVVGRENDLCYVPVTSKKGATFFKKAFSF